MRQEDASEVSGDGVSSRRRSIREAAKERLLSALRDIKSPQKILILDAGTVKVVDAMASMVEILDCGVFLLENIALGRQPYPQMAAVYVLTSASDTIALLGRDFTPPRVKLTSGRTGPMYAEAHLFFIDGVSREAMKQIASSPVAPYVRTFVELRLDFVPLESRVFHVTATDPAKSVLLDQNGAYTVNDVERMSAQLADVILLMMASGEDGSSLQPPIIRYQRSSLEPQSVQLALRLQKQLEAAATNLKPAKPEPTGMHSLSRTASSGSSKAITQRPTLLLLDRAVDLISPLLHEFSLQAMATDLLDLGPDGTRYTYQTTGGASKGASLDEGDRTWVSLRHVHVADATNIVIGAFNKFLSDNRPVLAVTKKTEASDRAKATSIRDLKDLVAGLGEFQETKSEYALHISLVEACFAASNKKDLAQLGVFEQNIVLGTDADGRKLGDQWNEFSTWLTHKSLTSLDRARLLAVYFLSLRASTSSSGKDLDLRSIIQSASLDRGHALAVQRLVAAANGRRCTQREINRVRGSSRELITNRPFEYESSRYVPAIKVIIEDLLNGDLDDVEFPFIDTTRGGSLAEVVTQSNTQKGPVSLRAKKGPTTAPSMAARGGPIFVFVMGGITYSEMRSVYELSKQGNRDIYIGSTQILTPARFLSLLSGPRS